MCGCYLMVLLAAVEAAGPIDADVWPLGSGGETEIGIVILIGILMIETWPPIHKPIVGNGALGLRCGRAGRKDWGQEKKRLVPRKDRDEGQEKKGTRAKKRKGRAKRAGARPATRYTRGGANLDGKIYNGSDAAERLVKIASNTRLPDILVIKIILNNRLLDNKYGSHRLPCRRRSTGPCCGDDPMHHCSR